MEEIAMRYNIDGEFPMMSNWLIVNNSGKGVYYVKNILTDEVYELNSNTYHFLRNLNGNRNPRKVARKFGVDADKLMRYFEANLLIRTEGRELLNSEGNVMLTVYIPKKTKTKSMLPKLYNFFLCVGWLPMLLYGIYRLFVASYRINKGYMVIGGVFGIVIGMVMHEISHAMACLAYGGYFLEAGIMREKVYSGAYVLIDHNRIGSRLKRIQVDAAGAEMNLMLTGLFLTLSTMIVCLNGLFLYAAMINGISALLNLAFIDESDGCAIVGELIGLPEGVKGAKRILSKSIRKKKIREMSENGKAAIFTCIIMIVYQVLVPIVLINNVLLIIGGFL